MIIVRHQRNGTLDGKEQSFDKDVVSIGRRPSNDIIFDPETDRLVSGNHAEIRRAGETLLVRDLGSTNGTFVNGRRISSDHVVQAGDRITLGSTGPEFSTFIALEMPAAREDTKTIAAHAIRIPSGSEEIESALRAAESPRAAVPPIQAGPGPMTAGARRRPTLSANPPQGVGPSTLMRILRQERRRTIGGMLFVVLPIVLAAGGWILYRGGFSPRPAPTAPVSAPLPPKSELIARAKPAVYLACLRRNGSSDSDTGFGTVWGVGENVCATNAHVAKVFLDRKKTETVVLRSCRPPHAELRVIDAVLHPGYEVYSKLVDEIRPFDPNTGRIYQADSPTDVALLVIHPDDVKKASAPLEIAANDELLQLKAGDEVMYVGYPQEGTQGGGVDVQRPEPAAGADALTKISDAFYGRGEPEESIVLTYGFDAIGGASGSPVLNRAGKVIGLMAAGNGGGLGASGERILLGAIGPRVDLVRELLDKTAPAKQKARTASWRAHLLDLYRRGVADPANLPVRIVDNVTANSAIFKIEGLKSATFDRGISGKVDPASKRARFNLPATNARTVIVLAAEDVPNKVTMRLVRGRHEDEVSGLDALPYLSVESIPANTEVTIEAAGTPGAFGAAQSMKLYVFRAN